jgi:transposase
MQKTEEQPMSSIPVNLTQSQFEGYVLPHLSTAQRGYVSKIPLYKIFNYILYFLHTGCQWEQLPMAPDAHQPDKTELSWNAVNYHFRKWSKDGSLERVWTHSIEILKKEAALDLSQLNLDGTHTIAKKGGESVAYQGRQRANTSNILPLTDACGYIVGTTEIIAGNHNDAFNLKAHLQTVFHQIKQLGLSLQGTYFNADSAFDTKDARKVCFNHGLIPNIAENKRNRKKTKPGRRRLFRKDVYKDRFTNERSFAWVDKFKRLVLRYERKDVYFFGLHCIAFAMINLRHVLD